ncbi:MAG: TrkH family potassium uptake protein, partial [Prevotellaceae bacterium]|nr:TrkH family potassium uptake protein [Prevotellaceae bacterium]
ISVTLTWIFLSFFGMLPYLISGYIPNVTDAYFETISGFTTTGATALDNIDVLPHSILFWRSLTHWIGGMGIIFFTLALLPALGMGEQQLFSAESTGLKLGKLHPRVSTTTHWLWSTYLIVTIACALTYYLCGMGVFDAVNYAFATIATGGFGTHGTSIAYFNSPLIEYAAVVFMMLSSINFTLLYLTFFKRRWRNIFRDEELRLYLFLVVLAVTIITLSKWLEAGDLSEHGFRESLFNVVAMMSTTGFTTEDFLAWPHLTWIILLTMGVIGSCSGSTAGGVKVVRILTAIKIIRNEFRRLLHPRAVLSLRINQDKLGTDVVQSIFAYTCFFILLVTVGASTLIVMGLPLFDALGLSISAFSNVGPSIGYAIGPLDSWNELHDGGLYVTSFLMIAGRLEIFAFLLPFVPSFW